MSGCGTPWATQDSEKSDLPLPNQIVEVRGPHQCRKLFRAKLPVVVVVLADIDNAHMDLWIPLLAEILAKLFTLCMNIPALQTSKHGRRHEKVVAAGAVITIIMIVVAAVVVDRDVGA